MYHFSPLTTFWVLFVLSWFLALSGLGLGGLAESRGREKIINITQQSLDGSLVVQNDFQAFGNASTQTRVVGEANAAIQGQVTSSGPVAVAGNLDFPSTFLGPELLNFLVVRSSNLTVGFTAGTELKVPSVPSFKDLNIGLSTVTNAASVAVISGNQPGWFDLTANSTKGTGAWLTLAAGHQYALLLQLGWTLSVPVVNSDNALTFYLTSYDSTMDLYVAGQASTTALLQKLPVLNGASHGFVSQVTLFPISNSNTFSVTQRVGFQVYLSNVTSAALAVTVTKANLTVVQLV
jgi:hypothetical protein